MPNASRTVWHPFPMSQPAPEHTLRACQRAVDEWIADVGVRYFSELTNTAVLMEEVGELARIMARTFGEQSFKEGEEVDLGMEMADVLFVLLCLANQTGVDLEESSSARWPRRPDATAGVTRKIPNSNLDSANSRQVVLRSASAYLGATSCILILRKVCP